LKAQQLEQVPSQIIEDVNAEDSDVDVAKLPNKSLSLNETGKSHTKQTSLIVPHTSKDWPQYDDRSGNSHNRNTDNLSDNDKNEPIHKKRKKRHSTPYYKKQLLSPVRKRMKPIKAKTRTTSEKKKGIPIIRPTKASLIVGDNESQAIFIDESLHLGISSPCKAFASPILVTNEKGEFEIKYAELWSVE